MAASALEGFTGAITPAKTGLLYKIGLAVVAFAMVLLPLIYIALIGLAAWGVYLHLTHNLWIISSRGGGLFRLIAYLGPAVVGGILVFFMVKPFFAKRGKSPDPVTLDRAQEPLLFAFVEKICGLVGARTPSRIYVDCQVNASAGLKKGLWSNDLVLTIGLPLVSGLSMREFAGVLAHEFGHFSQGAGMRMTYVIRNINFWFARVVYERDAWDQQLDHLARGSDLRIGIVLHGARGCVWLTRRILWALMHAGNAISCFMLRQMEYDADSYEAKVVGSDTFESTASQLRVLSVASQQAYEDVRQSWTNNRLPENLPLLVDLKCAGLSQEIRHKIAGAGAAEKTGWFDTHPCDSDRVKAVQRLGEPGVFRIDSPARGLFADFGQVSRGVTLHQYENQFELKFTEANLMNTEEIVSENAANSEAEAMVKEFYGGVNITLAPLLISASLDGFRDEAAGLAAWNEARKKTVALRPEAEKLSVSCIEEQRRLMGYTSALYLAKAGFQVKPEDFGLPAKGASPTEQEGPANLAAQNASKNIQETVAQMEPFMAALRERVTVALSFALGRCAGGASDEAARLREMVELLAATAAELPNLHQMGARLTAFGLLGQNRGNHSDPAQVDKTARVLVGELNDAVEGLQKRLNEYAYPFPHARGRLTVAQFARAEAPDSNEFQSAYADASTHLDRLFTLHYRLLGKVLARARSAEKNMLDGMAESQSAAAISPKP